MKFETDGGVEYSRSGLAHSALLEDWDLEAVLNLSVGESYQIPENLVIFTRIS